MVPCGLVDPFVRGLIFAGCGDWPYCWHRFTTSTISTWFSSTIPAGIWHTSGVPLVPYNTTTLSFGVVVMVRATQEIGVASAAAEHQYYSAEKQQQ